MLKAQYVVDPTLASVKLVYGLINHDNQSHITPTTVRLGVPRDNTQPTVPRNTELLLTGVPPAMIGQETVYYNRLSLSEYLQHVTPLPIQSDVVSTMHELIDTINATYGLAFSKDEVVDTPLDFRNTVTNYLTLEDSCLAWRGRVVVLLTPNRQPISVAVVTNILDGLEVVNGINEINANLYGYGYAGLIPDSVAAIRKYPQGATIKAEGSTSAICNALRAETGDNWQSSNYSSTLNLTGATVIYKGSVADSHYPPAPSPEMDQISVLSFDSAMTSGIAGDFYFYYPL